MKSDNEIMKISGDSPLVPAPEAVGTSVFSRILEISRVGNSQPLTIRAIFRALDCHTFALLILSLHLINAIPIPNPLLCVVVGILAALVSVQALAGRQFLWLPRRFLAITINPRDLERGMTKIQRMLLLLERNTRRRLTGFAGPKASRLSMVLVFVLSLLIATVLPVGNFLISVGIVILCIGLLAGDGAYALAGVGVSLVGVVWAAMITGGVAYLAWMALKHAVDAFFLRW